MKIKILNQYQLKGERNNRSRIPVICGDKILVGFHYDKKGFTESRLQCLNRADFSLVWEFVHPHVIMNIAAYSDSQIIVGFMNGTVISFDTGNGKILWQFVTEESNIGALSNIVDSKIVVSSIQCKQGYTWCLNAADGTIIWKQPNAGHSYTPLIYNGSVFNCVERNVFCLKLSDGLSVWTDSEPATYLFGLGIIKKYIAASGHGLINFYDIDSGKKINCIDTGMQSGIRQMIQDDETIFFGDEKGFFYACSKDFLSGNGTPEIKWKTDTGGRVETTPLVKGDHVFLINDAAKLLALNKHSGNIDAELKIKGTGDTSGIVENGGRLYFSCAKGFVYECTVEYN